MAGLTKLCLLVVAATALLFLNGGRADDPPEPDTRTAEFTEQVVNDIEVLGIREDGTRYRVDRPHLLRTFFDPNRGRDLDRVQTGALWAWGDGRPIALTEVWRWGDRGGAWGQTLISTTPGYLTASLHDGTVWKPEQPGLDFAQFTGAPGPAEATEERIRQMDELITRFSGFEMEGRQVVDLQMLSEPLHHYQEEGIDGAIFVLGHNGNPEALLFLEAVSDPIRPSFWRFAWIKATSAPVTVELDGKELLHIPGSRHDTGSDSATFWVAFRRMSSE